MKLSAIAWVRESYRRRFRIESRYRLLEAARGRTSSRDAGWRLWYVVLGAVLLNLGRALRRARSRPRAGAAWPWWNRLLVALIHHRFREPATGEGPSATPRRHAPKDLCPN